MGLKIFDKSRKRAPVRNSPSILSRILSVKLSKVINVDNLGQKSKLFRAGLGTEEKKVQTK